MPAHERPEERHRSRRPNSSRRTTSRALPELEQRRPAIDLAAGAGPLAAGRAAIPRHAKHAPSSPGVYRMIDANGDVLYVGKAKNIRKRIVAYTRPTGYDPRIERMIAATAALEFVSTATETEALLLEANLIKRLRPRFNVLLRDDKSFPYILITADHWAPQILKHRGARNRDGQLLRPVRLGVGGQPHHHGAAARVPAALLLRRLLREPHAAVPAATRSSAARRPARARSSSPTISELVREANALPLRQEPRGEGGARRRDGEGLRARSISSAPRSTATGSPRSRPCRRTRASIRAASRRPTSSPSIRTAASPASRCSSSAPARTGATAPISPRPTARSAAGEVLGAFLAQFYDDKPCPRCILHLARDRGARAAGRGA